MKKLPKQHSMSGHHGHASVRPFKWRFAGGPMMAAYSVIWIHSSKEVAKFDPLWQNFLDPCMISMINRMKVKVCTYCKCGICIQVVDDKSICGKDVTSHCIQTKEVGSRQVSVQLVPDLALKMHNQNTFKHYL